MLSVEVRWWMEEAFQGVGIRQTVMRTTAQKEMKRSTIDI